MLKITVRTRLVKVESFICKPDINVFNFNLILNTCFNALGIEKNEILDALIKAKEIRTSIELKKFLSSLREAKDLFMASVEDNQFENSIKKMNHIIEDVEIFNKSFENLNLNKIKRDLVIQTPDERDNIFRQILITLSITNHNKYPKRDLTFKDLCKYYIKNEAEQLLERLDKYSNNEEELFVDVEYIGKKTVDNDDNMCMLSERLYSERSLGYILLNFATYDMDNFIPANAEELTGFKSFIASTFNTLNEEEINLLIPHLIALSELYGLFFKDDISVSPHVGKYVAKIWIEEFNLDIDEEVFTKKIVTVLVTKYLRDELVKNPDKVNEILDSVFGKDTTDDKYEEPEFDENENEDDETFNDFMSSFGFTDDGQDENDRYDDDED